MSADLSLAKSVAAVGGIEAWNEQSSDLKALNEMIDAMVTPTSCDEALTTVKAMLQLGHYLWAYMYMRKLYEKDANHFFCTILREPSTMLPVMYTPTVGEACQKFGQMPMRSRGCYISITDRGNIKKVLQEYAEKELEKEDGKPACDCIVFSDGGRILGLGDLGAFGMGIPIGKLDLYTACGGFNPHRTIPVMIDAGVGDSSKNTAGLDLRGNPLYTGLKQDRVTHRSQAGTVVNTAYYGEDSMIGELMRASEELFGRQCLLQFEDFNSNDAFPLLAEYREKYLCYNDDIQGTAAVTVAGIMGAIKLKHPTKTDLIGALKDETYLFHGAGSANLGAISLLAKEGGVPMSKLFITNSRGLIWRAEDGSDGTGRNDEQREFAHVGKPDFNSKSLVSMIENLQPSVLVGAVGVAPGCFDKDVVEAMLSVNADDTDGRSRAGSMGDVGGAHRPVVFALSNPKSQAEVTAEDCYNWSYGQAIFGSGTQFDPVTVSGRTYSPGMVNNVYIFPGVSFGAAMCHATTIPDRLFLVAAEAVANTLSEADLEADRVIPTRDRVRQVSLNVATAVVVEAQKLGLAGRNLGTDEASVREAVQKLMWKPCMK